VTLKAVVDTVAGAAQILRMSFDQTCQGATTALHGTVDIEHSVGEEIIPGMKGARSIVGEGGTSAYTVLSASAGHHYLLLHLVKDGRDTAITSGSTDAWVDGLDAGRLAYQQTLPTNRDNSDIHLLDLATMTQIPLPGVNTVDFEWNVDVSGNRLVFARDNARDTRWAIFLYDLTTHALRRIATGTPRNGTAPEGINGDYVVWEACKGWRCNALRYRISTGHVDVLKAPRTRTYYGLSVLSDGTVYGVSSGNGCGIKVSIFRWRPGSKPVIVHRFSKYRDVALPDIDQFAGTTYLYYSHISCARTRFQKTIFSGARLPVSVPK
jgi:hypothetical protein